jgi:hypothetical protein
MIDSVVGDGNGQHSDEIIYSSPSSYKATFAASGDTQ